jgi:chitin disaccharide deacetylase
MTLGDGGSGAIPTAATNAAASVSKRLIVNADDLGLSHGITDGILFAHRHGIVTSASFMVNQPASDYAVARLRNVPGLDVGIHLNLCQGKPVLPPPAIHTLVDANGNFLPPPQIAKKLTYGQASPKEIEAEFRAQIDLMLSVGLKPSHADSHHRFHIYPAAAMAFDRAVRSRGIYRARAAAKKFWPSKGNFTNAHAGSFLRRAGVYFYNYFLQSVVFRNLKLPDAGVAFHPAFRGKLDKLPEAWNFTLKNMPGGTYEIWCHPGFPEKGFSETDPLREQRSLELGILTSPQLTETIHEAGIRLTNFKQL